MKRFVIFGLVTVITLNISANAIGSDTEIPMTDVNEGHTNNGGHRAPALIPTVSYVDNYLYITSPYLIEEMSIIIYDENGNVIYSVTMSISATTNILILPQSVVDLKYSLVIGCNDYSYVGFF